MAETLRFLLDRTRTPIGELLIVADGEGRLRAVGWSDREEELQRSLQRRFGAAVPLAPERDPSGLTSAITAYFEGEWERIDGLAVATGGTPFQQSVWAALRSIPCGATVAYSELARRVGRPAAVRAVGLANGSNPIAVVLPCHRVIGQNGGLTGYAGGLDRKRWLLAHESARSQQTRLPLVS